MKESGLARELQRLAERYWAFCCFEQPFNAILAGEDPADDVLFRESPGDHDRRCSAAVALLAELGSIPVDALAIGDRATQMLLRRELEAIRDFHRAKAHLRPSLYPAGPDFNLVYFANSASINSVDAADRFVARLATVPAFIADLEASLLAGHQAGFRYPRHMLGLAAQAVRAHLTPSAEESALFGPFRRCAIAGRASLTLARQEAARLIATEIMPAFEVYAAFLDSTLAEDARDTIGLQDDLWGREYYELLVRHFTSLELTALEVHELGLGEVARVQGEIDTLAADAGFGGDSSAYRRYLSSERAFIAPDPETHLARVRALCKRIDAHLPAYFGKLPRITYGVECIPPGLSASMPPAYAQPSPADHSAPGIFWLNGNTEKCPTYLYPSLALHEAWPGHLMQIALMQEQKQLPKFRRHGSLKYTACIEGWAMYCEQLGIPMGLYATPHEHFGRLNMELWRSVRLVVDTGIHILGWTRDQAISYMADRVCLPLPAVASEIDRYVALPGQALAYQPGNLKFRELRARAERALGDRFDLRSFHDALIAAGPVTLTVLDELVSHWLEQQERGNDRCAA